MRPGRYKVQLRQGGGSPRQELRDVDLDVRDFAELREVLEGLVFKDRGHLRVKLEDWWLRVTGPGIRPTEVRVNRAGETVVDGRTLRDHGRQDYARR